MRRIQNRWIAPGQPPQILAIHAEFLRSLNDVAEMPAQSPRRSLVAQMRKRCGPPRKHRHQRLTRLGQLGLQSGPRPPRRLKIRLLTRIDNGFSFPRRSHLSRTKLAFTQPRLKPRSPLHRAPQGRWLEPQWLVALKHGAKLRDPMLRTLPDAHRSARGRIPRRLQQPGQTIRRDVASASAPTCRTSGIQTNSNCRHFGAWHCFEHEADHAHVD